ncbi:MAG: peroxiredoxin [Saprospiraceae bacterium]|jgi:peroxiredoxin
MVETTGIEKISGALSTMHTQRGETLSELSSQQSILIVFLRPFGCIFCMEAMRDLGVQRAYLESKGVKICCVHMASSEVAESYFGEYGLENIDHVSDQDCKFYHDFGLLKGNFSQLYGLKIWLRTAELAVRDLRRLRMRQIGDGFQMPGVFFAKNNALLNQYSHRRTSDRPNYRNLIIES